MSRSRRSFPLSTFSRNAERQKQLYNRTVRRIEREFIRNHDVDEMDDFDPHTLSKFDVVEPRSKYELTKEYQHYDETDEEFALRVEAAKRK